MKAKLIVCLALFSVAILPSVLHAQQAEIYPYAGGFWPARNDHMGKYQTDGIYGVKASGFVTSQFQLGGNLGYINHFAPSPTNPVVANTAALGLSMNPTRAFMWEMTGDFNLTGRDFIGRSVTPYLSLGAGGLTTKVHNGNSVTYAPVVAVDDDGDTVFRPGYTLEDGDTFFTFSYGGGVKALQIWGPVGLRGDIRGRTMPNYFGKAMSWPEATGGITISWGER